MLSIEETVVRLANWRGSQVRVVSMRQMRAASPSLAKTGSDCVAG